MSTSPIDQDTATRDAGHRSTITVGQQVQVLLCGGPAEQLPQEERVHSVPDADSVIKLLRGAHYDHYAPTAQRIRHDGRELRVFTWSHRTFVAE